ncbi:MAG: SCO family protein [Thermoprotei archaeon]|nr:SCO family protein [Thermoprotei archaeon]
MGSVLKLAAVIGLAFALSIAVALAIGYIVGSVIIPYVAGESSYIRNPYVVITEPNIHVKSFTLNSTYGPLKIPVDGKVNVYVLQYVRCPDICHWNTAILLALFEHAYEENALDKIAFITIGIDPWNETLELARRYQDIKAKKMA